MGPYLNRFSIRDLEEFSGVKAHTIRIWERRYGILDPDRTDTNIRTYGLDELKTILNVAFLNRYGVKISRIAALSEKERDLSVKELAEKQGSTDDALNALKLSMVSYDTEGFERTSAAYLDREGFRNLVERLYVPLLECIGLLWQSNSICPAQEHFVSNLVRQKLIAAIDGLRPTDPGTGTTHVLYLPQDEIHELGLLYVHYLLRARGERVVFLGQSVPKDDLAQVVEQFTGPVRFISIFTAFPQSDSVATYLADLRKAMPDKRVSFLVTGSRVVAAQLNSTPPGVMAKATFKELVAALF
jgi:DNA-binding transcriptional MerR regulator